MLMAVQFQSFEHGEVLGFPAQNTGEPILHSRLNMYHFISLGYREKDLGSQSNKDLVPGIRSFHPYSHKLSKARSQGGVKSWPKARIDDCDRGGLVRRLQCRLFQRLCKFIIFEPCMIPRIVNFFFRDLYRAGYDLIKANTSKLTHYKTRQEAEFNINTFKEDQKCH